MNLNSIKRAETVGEILDRKEQPLKNIRLLKELKPIGLDDWLKLKLGYAYIYDDIKLQEQVLECVENLKRTRGRPRMEKNVPRPKGRPKFYSAHICKIWLDALDRAATSEKYNQWRERNNERDSDKAKLLYILELININEYKSELKKKAQAKKELKTHQNLIGVARKLLSR